MRISDWSSDVCSSDLQASQTKGIGQFLPVFQVSSIENISFHNFLRGTNQFRCGGKVCQYSFVNAFLGIINRLKDRITFPFNGFRISQDRKSTSLNSSH